MRIAITGSSGLVGSAVADYFKAQGHFVAHILRPSSPKINKIPHIVWDIDKKSINTAALEGHDVFIHLAGASIADKRWTRGYKNQIYASRVDSTALLSHALSKLRKPPAVFISASAVGYYGYRSSLKTVDEGTVLGKGFLAGVCKDWERATEALEKSSIRVIHARFGMVLSQKGGALAKMLPIFKLGLGGKIGSGKQMISWVALEEIPLMMDFIIRLTHLRGPVNFVSPQAVTNREFTKTLGRVIHQPAFLPLPSLAAKLMFGQMANELLLNGLNVLPRRLKEQKYSFKYTDLESALKNILT